jgi:ACT domain-containing protein
MCQGAKEMLDETRAKLERVKELLKQGYSLRKAIRGAGLGCKSYYKYEGYVLADESVPKPKKISVVNVGGPYRVEKFLVDMLRDIAKHILRKVLIKRYGSPRALKKHGDEYKRLVKDLVNRWLYEMLVES